MNGPSYRDLEILSAYLDGQLSASENKRLETRLKSDPSLRSALDELGCTRNLFRRLPHRRSPRNFMLTPKMVGLRPPMPHLYPVFRLAATIATLLLIFTFAANLTLPLVSAPQMAMAPFFMPAGKGGGGETAELEALTATEQPPAPEAAEALALAAPPELGATAEPVLTVTPTETALGAGPEGTPAPALAAPITPGEDAGLAKTVMSTETVLGVEPEGTPVEPSERTMDLNMTPEVAEIPQEFVGGVGGGPESGLTVTPPTKIPWLSIEIGLGVLALISGMATLILRHTAIRKWHQKAK